jgi:hypothetical protein
MPDGSITLHISGGGVIVGVVVSEVDVVRLTDTELLGLREMDRERVGLPEMEGGMAIVPAKL